MSYKIKSATLKTILSSLIFLVWFINGLFCKVLNLVPRHQMIVARVLGEDNSSAITKTIGVLEILMAFWILSKIKSRWCAYTQIFLVSTMNIMEAALAPDLLLFGYANIFFAFLFVALIYWNEFYTISENKK